MNAFDLEHLPFIKITNKKAFNEAFKDADESNGYFPPNKIRQKLIDKITEFMALEGHNPLPEGGFECVAINYDTHGGYTIFDLKNREGNNFTYEFNGTAK